MSNDKPMSKRELRERELQEQLQEHTPHSTPPAEHPAVPAGRFHLSIVSVATAKVDAAPDDSEAREPTPVDDFADLFHEPKHEE